MINQARPNPRPQGGPRVRERGISLQRQLTPENADLAACEQHSDSAVRLSGAAGMAAPG
eukprot:CAMPEP_0119165742 /NCGR_PEP_ID=MMETSP1315-20130426/5334_1 /TAXON_ID=676789 /ORGANISM="Prasinoderma singularis, Strain RCC927" /LENGTH=58 /DNA_ID=CAMNT_0007159051 /DNA_START=53 /DNA_END=226 /DNA_ORIENTATION=+